jgi:hypothetical protein
MKRLIFIASFISLMFGCEKNQDNLDSALTARIVGFDLNCSTCILEFPDDNSQVKKEIGESPGDYYQTVNLSKGSYEIGQILKVKIRKAKTEELTPCISLYPSYSYKNVFVTGYENFNNLIFNDTIDLSYRECLTDPENQMYICLDSVTKESRCPSGVECFWAGYAEVRFKFEKGNSTPVFFNLGTVAAFKNDTIIDGYKFTLIDLSPWPTVGHRILQKEYKAKIIVNKI